MFHVQSSSSKRIHTHGSGSRVGSGRSGGGAGGKGGNVGVSKEGKCKGRGSIGEMAKEHNMDGSFPTTRMK